MPLILGLLTENVTLSVYVEKMAQDASGGSTFTLGTALATGVTALFASPSGARAGDFHSDNEREHATLVSSSPYVDRQDSIFKITATTDPALSEIVNTYWRVESPQAFPAGSLGIVPARYQAVITRYVIPS